MAFSSSSSVATKISRIMHIVSKDTHQKSIPDFMEKNIPNPKPNAVQGIFLKAAFIIKKLYAMSKLVPATMGLYHFQRAEKKNIPFPGLLLTSDTHEGIPPGPYNFTSTLTWHTSYPFTEPTKVGIWFHWPYDHWSLGNYTGQNLHLTSAWNTYYSFQAPTTHQTCLSTQLNELSKVKWSLRCRKSLSWVRNGFIYMFSYFI